MRTYLVYESEDGTIVHAHKVAEGARHEPEDVLRLVHKSLKGAKLDVLEIDPADMRSGEVYRVNPKSRKLEASKGGGAHCGAGARQASARKPML
jgi:hypothetical protein